MDKRKILCELGFEDSIVFDEPAFDDAIIGFTDDGRVVYDYDSMAESMMVEENISWEDAVDLRPSQNLCKPPLWCRIGAPQWR